MNMFEGANNSADVQKDQDRVRGQKQAPLPSSIQDMIIKHAYGAKAGSGALGIHMLLETADGSRQIKYVEYVISGDKKGNKTYYEKKVGDEMQKFNLPGYTMMNDMAELVTGKPLLQLANEKRTIKLWSKDANGEVPTDVDMLIDLVGKPVRVCVLSIIEDKTKKNDQTGNYDPTGQTYATNTVDKFLHPQDRRTAGEMRNDIPSDFAEKWEAKWNDQVDDRSTEVKDAGMKGAPQASGDDTAKSGLFS